MAILMMSREVLFKAQYLSRVLVNQIGSNNNYCVLMVSIRSIIASCKFVCLGGILIFDLLRGCIRINWNSPLLLFPVMHSLGTLL